MAASGPRYNVPLIRWRIDELELTQAQIAAYVGCSEPQLSRILHGDRNPKPEQRERLARALGMKEELLYLPEQVAA